MYKIFSSILIILLCTLIIFYSCSKTDTKNELYSAGATFPAPLYLKMFDVYYQEKQIKINYEAVGSGAGITKFLNKITDFGASDAFLTDEELKSANIQIIQIPTCLGAVSIIFNLQGINTLKLTPDVLADIFLGKITEWNDKKISEINPGVNLPPDKITVVHRLDGSGTTFVFTDYLSKISDTWRNTVGKGKLVKWPIGLEGNGNSGVGELVSKTKSSIGYVELEYALKNKMGIVLLRNNKNNFILPSLKSTYASANVSLPEDIRVSLTNGDVEDGYPIVSFTWLLVYREQNYNERTEDRAKEVVKLLWWMTHDGQRYAEPLSYASLPEGVIKKVEEYLKSITYNGKKVMDTN